MSDSNMGNIAIKIEILSKQISKLEVQIRHLEEKMSSLKNERGQPSPGTNFPYGV